MRTLIFLTAISIQLVHAVADQPTPPRDFGFRPLEIYEFKPGSSRLIVADMNNDGLDDVLFANNHVSRLEILLRKPNGEPLDDLPELSDHFEDKGIIVDQAIKAVRVGDLNNDGRMDIATFGTAIGLQIRYQQEDGAFSEPERYFIKDRSSVNTIQIGDLNGDEMKDILIARRNRADLHWNSDVRPFQKKKTLPFSNENSFYGDISDVNGDHIPDLAFHFNTTRNPLKIRLGKGHGQYGIEQSIDLPQRQYMDILQSEEFIPQIGMVLRNRLAFRTYGFAEKEQPQLLDTQENSPGRIGLEGTNKKDAPAWLSGDFNGDGMDDLLIAAPELSRLHLYTGGETGLNPEPQRIDTLSDVVRLSRKANGDILAYSRKEKIAALHSADNLTDFPSIVKTPGDVLAACAVEASDESWFVCKNADRELQLVRIEGSSDTATVFSLDAQNEPSDILAFSLPDDQTGLILFMPYDTPKMMLSNGDTMEELTSESFRALTLQLALSNIQLTAPGDGRELIVSHGAIARRFEWKGDHYDVVHQFNPENPRGELIASCNYNLLDGSVGTVLYDRNSGDLIHFSTTSEDWGKIHIPDADQTIFDLVQLNHPSRDLIILLDRTGLNEVTGNGLKLNTVSTGEYISPTENALLAYAKLVELGSPPRPMVALVDAPNRSLELVSPKNGELVGELIFKVFLTSDFAHTATSRGSEPHGVESGDLNGDNIGDLVLLVHDKLLIYLGE